MAKCIAKKNRGVNMAKYNSNNLSLEIDEKLYINTLDLDGFSGMVSSPSSCYKFYWLEALVKLISEDLNETTFNDVIDEMIANAWYTVVEFHIHLSGMVTGEFRDALENAIIFLKEASDLKSNASKVEIKNAIKENESVVRKYKNQLTQMVPYRALSVFFKGETEKVIWNNKEYLIDYIERVNKHKILPYTLGEESGLDRKVYINPIWKKIIQDNTVQILGWIQYEKIKWLQSNNPEVPGIVYKLQSLDDSVRKLNKVRNLWKAILDVRNVKDVFTNKSLNGKEYDIDHFVPWSFVMNDELWNLMPTDSSLNSSKSNLLPNWEKFFIPFARNQFLMYEEINKKEQIRNLYEKCYKDNIHSIWASQELYIKGNGRLKFYNILEKNMRPVYDSAKRQGYQMWER